MGLKFFEKRETTIASKILQQVASKPEENVAFSPFLIRSALSVLLMGVPEGNKTERALKAALGVHTSFSRRELARIFRDLLTRQQGFEEFKLDQRLFLHDEFHAGVKADHFLDKYFLSPIYRMSFKEVQTARAAASDFVESNIQKSLNTSVLKDDGNMLLISAGNFVLRPVQELLRKKVTHASFALNEKKHMLTTVVLAQGIFKFGRVKSLNATVLELKLKSSLSLFLILPDQGKPVSTLFKKLDLFNLQFIESQLKEGPLNVVLPFFDVTYELDVLSHSKALGLAGDFPQTADFTGFSSSPMNPTLRQAIQIVNIVFEGQFESSLAMSLNPTQFSNETFRFDVNRPFVFVIKDSTSCTNLASGVVMKPRSLTALQPFEEKVPWPIQSNIQFQSAPGTPVMVQRKFVPGFTMQNGSAPGTPVTAHKGFQTTPSTPLACGTPQMSYRQFGAPVAYGNSGPGLTPNGYGSKPHKASKTAPSTPMSPGTPALSFRSASPYMMPGVSPGYMQAQMAQSMLMMNMGMMGNPMGQPMRSPIYGSMASMPPMPMSYPQNFA